MQEPFVKLNDGNAIPQIGQGLSMIKQSETVQNVRDGIKAGYQAVDTAAMYGNEEGVGEAIRESGEDIFVTSKMWYEGLGRDAARQAFNESFQRLGLKQIDLFLIHWPVPQLGLSLDSWKTLIDLRDEGQVRSIGVSNFRIEDLQVIIEATGVVPVTNQIELHPAFPQDELVEFHRGHGIATTSWSPLGQGATLKDERIIRIARKHTRTPAQIVIRWHLEHDFIVIPKASSFERLSQNRDVLDFALDQEDIAIIATIASPDGRIGPDPADFSIMEMEDARNGLIKIARS